MTFKSRQGIITARAAILELAAGRERLETDKPNKDTLMGAVILLSVRLTHLRTSVIEALRDFPPGMDDYRNSLERIRDHAIDVQNSLSGKKTKDGLKQDQLLLESGIDTIAALASQRLQEEVKATVAPFTWNDTLQMLFPNPERVSAVPPEQSKTTSNGWPLPATHVDAIGLFSLMCKTSAKWGLYLRFDRQSEDGLRDLVNLETGYMNAAPYFSSQSLVGANPVEQFLIFDTGSEMEKCFFATLGDGDIDSAAPYQGPSRVFAQAFGPDGLEIAANMTAI